MRYERALAHNRLGALGERPTKMPIPLPLFDERDLPKRPEAPSFERAN
jgi:hypothetical protein